MLGVVRVILTTHLPEQLLNHREARYLAEVATRREPEAIAQELGPSRILYRPVDSNLVDQVGRRAVGVSYSKTIIYMATKYSPTRLW